jgi:hypothetical protein
MTPLEAQATRREARGERAAGQDLRALDKVRAIFARMSKYISAKTIYTSNNPNLRKIADAFHQAFRAYFEVEKELVLTISRYQIVWREEAVYENDQKTESIAFLFYKDGVGEIIFQSAVSAAELEQFVDILRSEVYSPSSHLDVVGRLWQANFTNIFYRIFDETCDGAQGDGRGTGSDAQEQPLRVNDHPNLPMSGATSSEGDAPSDSSIEPIAAYFRRIADRANPAAGEAEQEQHLQQLLESHFLLSSEELASCRQRFSYAHERDRVLWLLDIMLDFTRTHNTPAVVRDVRDIIDRLVRYVVEEVHVPTLVTLFDVQKKLSTAEGIAFDFRDIPDRIKNEITNEAFLISLGRLAHRSSADVLAVLQYFQLVGKDAVPGVCELLASSKDPATHKNACDTLITMAKDDVPQIVNELNLDNPHEAKDAVYLLSHFVTGEIPKTIHALMTSSDIQVREHAIEYLALVGSEEAARLLCRCLEDNDANIRIKALSVVEEFRHPLIVEKLTTMCFSDDRATRSGDELERMFRAVGKLAGESALPHIREMTKSRSWLPFGKTRAKHEKLLALTALRYIPGEAASQTLDELAAEGDTLVKTKAAYVMRQRSTSADSPTVGTPTAEQEERNDE